MVISTYVYNQSAWKLIFFGQVDDATGGRAKQVSVGCLSLSDNDVDDSGILGSLRNRRKLE